MCINATQVGLVWRVARKTVFLKNGGNEEDFIDTEPWDNPRNQGNQNQGRPAVPDPLTRSSGVKEHVLKMASLLDQSDESELVPAPTDKVQEWVLRYVTTMGSTPEEEEEATDAQLAALYKRTVVLKQAPYCDFSVWTPFGRRALRSQKFRREGSYLVKELPGPQKPSAMDGFVASLQSCGHLSGHSVTLGLAAVREIDRTSHASLATGVGAHSSCRW